MDAICDFCAAEVPTWVWYKGFLICNECFDVQCETCKFKAGLHEENCGKPPSSVKTCKCSPKDLFSFGCKCGGA